MKIKRKYEVTAITPREKWSEATGNTKWYSITMVDKKTGIGITIDRVSRKPKDLDVGDTVDVEASWI